MQTLALERTYRVVLPAAEQLNVILVGVGGTGSALALSLGRLAYHLKQKGVDVNLLFVDHDVVKSHNLGRQAFCEAEIGVRKAECLALRLNAALGLAITAAPVPFTAERFAEWTSGWQEPAGCNLLISAVDNYLARREVAAAIAAEGGTWHALSLGNEHHSGQILMGNATAPEMVRFDKLGLVSGIPSPYLQEPALLEPPPAGATPLSCAELTAREEQSLVVNQQVAAIAAEYVYQFLVRRELAQMATYFTLSPATTRSLALTEVNVNACFGERDES